MVRRAVLAGLRCIEWGADVHAPPDDPVRLVEVRQLSAAAGLRICSYGSYWRAGVHAVDDVSALAAAAVALGTDRIRIWAGELGNDEATAETWSRVVRSTREAAAIAAGHGCGLAFEFHGGTLTDTLPGTLRLLEQVDRPTVSSYWQPPVGLDTGPALAGLAALLDVVSAVHVFSWWPATTRRPLADRADLWTGALELLATRRVPVDLLLEFVPGDDPELLGPQARTLLEWMTATRR